MDPFIGEVKLFAGNFAPRGWAFCEGQLLPINQNQALFSLIGTIYGGDGRITFALPDLRGRVVIAPGSAPGLSSYREGQRGGHERVTLSHLEMPSHSHSLRASSLLGNSNSPLNNVLANTGSFDNEYSSTSPDVDMSSNAISFSGGNEAHCNMQPYLVIHYIIALQGVYPSRS